MRRLCGNCKLEYKHDEIIASGLDENGNRRHFVGCSWNCLTDLILAVDLDLHAPHNAQYE